jgi:trans-aconitate 2-methyltransferase
VTEYSHHWDAATYHRVADPQFRWGLRLIDRLDLRGDETVIDAGCGSGRLTKVLLEQLPGGRVIAIDASEQMIVEARRNLENDCGSKVEFMTRDLLDLALDEAADVVFSTATFHWITDQPRLYRNLARALKRGGRLLAQMGGKGNLARILGRADAITDERAYQPYFAGWSRPTEFPDEATTRQRMEGAGFGDIELQLFEEPTTFPDAQTFREFITAVNFRLHLQRIGDAALRKSFIDRIVEAAARDDPPYTLDYWRLNLAGIKK